MKSKMHTPGGLGRSFIATLSIGILFGFGFAYVLLYINTSTVQQSTLAFVQPPRLSPVSSINYIDAENVPHRHEGHHDPHSHDEVEDEEGPSKELTEHRTDEDMHKGEDIEAQALAKEVRVLCWIMTNPNNHKRKAIHVKRTWGKRCNKLLFMSSENDPELPSISLPNVEEGRNYLWAKTKEAFKYVFEHHLDDADWFMKADDDTYVVVENLRFLLKDYDFNNPIYFGCKFKPYVEQGYMSGGAGYVLSKEALRRFVEDAMPNPYKCRQDHEGAEDVEMGKCMQNVGVEAGDSRDGYGRYRFLPFIPEHHILPDQVRDDFWYWKIIYYPQKDGFDCCSDTTISFHYVPPNQMYVMDFLLYHLRPFGINTSVRKASSMEPNASSSSSSPPTQSGIESAEVGIEDVGGSSPVVTAASSRKPITRQPTKLVSSSVVNNKVIRSVTDKSSNSVTTPRREENDTY